MFGLDPFSRLIAISEIVLLLVFAAFVGWLIARLILNSRINGLRSDIAERERELAECRRARSPKTNTTAPVMAVAASKATADVSPASAPVTVIEDTPTAQTYAAPVASPLPVLVDEETSAPVIAQGSEAAVLNRIASRAGELNFDRIGRATAAEADDLKDIVGVGPFLERKLHSLGIYTFRQIANFTKEDIDKVNEIIEFFPGRIERDNWVGQSKVFHERKQGKA